MDHGDIGPVERKRLTNEHVDSWWELLRQTVSNGRTGFLYRSVYVAVDSTVNEELTGQFDITELQVLGLDGWEIVAVIPRTLGVALENSSLRPTFGRTWGAGLGGNVAGVHVLLRLAIDQAGLEDARADIEELVAQAE